MNGATPYRTSTAMAEPGQMTVSQLGSTVTRKFRAFAPAATPAKHRT